MPSERTSMPRHRKRQLCVEAEVTADSSPPPHPKRRKLEEQQQHRTPASFWDNLSRLWLTPRALREFDRRTVWPVAPVPPDRTGKEDIDLAQLKRFARHGGPGLGHLRAVSLIQPCSRSHRPSDCMLVSGTPDRSSFQSNDERKSIGLQETSQLKQRIGEIRED